MVKTEGLLWMHVQGMGERSTPSLQACQSKCLSEQVGAILYILGWPWALRLLLRAHLRGIAVAARLSHHSARPSKRLDWIS